MLKSLFKDVSDDSISYIEDENTSHSLEYYISENEKKVYLKIKSADRENCAAHTLSSIRELILKGEHRKDFSIICSYDEASLYYCCQLMKPMGIFERHLRELMYLIITKEFGIDWVKKTFPEEMIKKIKETTHGNLNDEKITESAFEYLDYGEVTTYLFSERYFKCSPEQLLEEDLSEHSLNTLSKEEIVSIINTNRKTTLWNKLFSNINNVNINTIDNIREYRNDVMHHHTLNNSRYNDIKNEVQVVDIIIAQAIDDIENRIYTKEESRIVYSSMGYAITQIIKAINDTTALNSSAITKAMGIVANNFSEIYNSYYGK